jgi:hypothetical protein
MRMNHRTTITARRDDLETLRAEARRRQTSLNRLLQELIAKEAAELRSARQPKLGIGRSGQGVARQSTDDEDAPAQSPYKS